MNTCPVWTSIGMSKLVPIFLCWTYHFNELNRTEPKWRPSDKTLFKQDQGYSKSKHSFQFVGDLLRNRCHTIHEKKNLLFFSFVSLLELVNHWKEIYVNAIMGAYNQIIHLAVVKKKRTEHTHFLTFSGCMTKLFFSSLLLRISRSFICIFIYSVE